MATAHPAPFSWADHDRQQAQIVADLYESIERWRAAAEAFGNQPVLYAKGDVK